MNNYNAQYAQRRPPMQGMTQAAGNGGLALSPGQMTPTGVGALQNMQHGFQGGFGGGNRPAGQPSMRPPAQTTGPGSWAGQPGYESPQPVWQTPPQGGAMPGTAPPGTVWSPQAGAYVKADPSGNAILRRKGSQSPEQMQQGMQRMYYEMMQKLLGGMGGQPSAPPMSPPGYQMPPPMVNF